MTVTKVLLNGEVVDVKPDLADCDCDRASIPLGLAYTIPAVYLYTPEEMAESPDLDFDFALDICANCGGVFGMWG